MGKIVQQTGPSVDPFPRKIYENMTPKLGMEVSQGVPQFWDTAI